MDLGPWRLRPRVSALRASFGSLIQQSSFPPPMHRGLDKTTGSFWPIFEAKECIRTQDFVLKYTKISRGRDPRTPAAEGETFVRTHPCAHLPDAGAPPLLLGWLRPWRPVAREKQTLLCHGVVVCGWASGSSVN